MNFKIYINLPVSVIVGWRDTKYYFFVVEWFIMDSSLCLLETYCMS
jgi:hypothetical protein